MTDRPTTLKQALEAKIAESERQHEDVPDFFQGGDWWQYGEADQIVFEIRADFWPRMMWTFFCYQAFKRMADSAEWDDVLLDAARAQYPQWCGPDSYDEDEFSAFGREFGRLTNREAFVMWHKQQCWEMRDDVMQFPDGS